MRTIAQKSLKHEPTRLGLGLAKLVGWLTDQQQRLLQIGLLLGGVALGTIVFYQWSNARSQVWAKDFAASYVAWQDAREKTAGAAPKGAELADDPNGKAAQDAVIAAQQRLEAVIAGAPAQQLGVLARLLRIELLPGGEPINQPPSPPEPTAAQLLSPMLEQLAPSNPFYFLVVEKLAYEAEAKGELQQAIGYWQKIPAEQGVFYSDKSLLQQARLALQLGQMQQAKEHVDLVRLRFPDSIFQAELTLLTSKLATSDGNELPAKPDISGKAITP